MTLQMVFVILYSSDRETALKFERVLIMINKLKTEVAVWAHVTLLHIKIDAMLCLSIVNNLKRKLYKK